MARAKVKLADNIARVVFIETDATIGATLGTNLFLPNGEVATPTTFAAWLGTTASGTVGSHRLLQGLTVGDDHPQYLRKDTLTTRGDVYVRGASTVQRLGVGTASQVMRSDGTDPVWQTVSPSLTLSTDVTGSATFTNLGNAVLATTITANAVTDAKFRQSAATSLVGRAANSAGDVADISASADGQVLRRSGGSLSFGDVPLVASSFANPTASIGLTAVNGSALTAMRSDAAPALDQGISPTWSGVHTYSNPILAASGSAANPSHTYVADPATGIYLIGTAQLGFATGGVRYGTMNAAGDMRFGDNQTEAFAGAGHLGLARNGFCEFSIRNCNSDTEGFIGAYTSEIAFGSYSNTRVSVYMNSSPRAALNTTFQWVVSDGSLALPGQSWINDLDTGRYRIGANNMGDVVGGALLVDYAAARVSFQVPVRLKGYTVATLPAGTVGDTAYVTDALAPAFLVAVVGGGAVTCSVFYDGTNWVVQ